MRKGENRAVHSDEHREAISTERLTRFYLQNHFLLRKAEKRDVVDVIGKLCGLHS